MNKFFYGLAATGMMCLFIGLGSCSKEGIMGPQGEQGIAGADGSIIHSGTGAPTETMGKAGDYYLDKSTTNLYGPRTDSGWGNPLNLKGAKGDSGTPGQDGTPGSQFHSGNGTAQASLGRVGDFYFDMQDVALYGPKTASGWGSAVSLKAANDNGVKIVVMKNHQFQKVIIETIDEDWVDKYLESRLVPIPDYTNYYENGVVLAYVKLSSNVNGAWATGLPESGTSFKLPANLGGSQVWITLSHESFTYGRDNLTVSAGYENEEYVNQSSVDDYILSNFLVDFKLVFIPGTQVSAMQSQHIDVSNATAVANFLKLEK